MIDKICEFTSELLVCAIGLFFAVALVKAIVLLFAWIF